MTLAMNESITITNAARVAGHTPGPWETDIDHAAETIASEGHYYTDWFHDAVHEIAGGCKNPKQVAAKAIANEAQDARIGAACVYVNHGSGKGGQICAFPHDTSDGLDITDAETKANAHLMKLAPDLLAFVLKVAERVSLGDAYTGPKYDRGELTKMARAILDAI